jgi:hypothetical protein
MKIRQLLSATLIGLATLSAASVSLPAAAATGSHAAKCQPQHAVA